MPSIGGNVSSLRDVLPLPPGLADPSYAGRAERTADVMRPGGFDQREAPGFHGCRPLKDLVENRPWVERMASSRLKWIVSTPIPDPDTPGAVLGVLNLDGLDVGKERNDLEILAGDLVAAAQGVAVMLKRAT